MLRQNHVTIDLNAIHDNYCLMTKATPKGVRVMAVVKANAYGHGMVEVAKTVIDAGATDLAVAIPEEGLTLRENGVKATILVLGAATEIAAEAAITNDLTQTVFDPHMIETLEDTAVRLGKDALVHIKLDTGMSRIGLRTEGEADALALALSQAKHVKVTGIYTHFADADNPPDDGGMNDFTKRQLERFLLLKSHFCADIPAHVANSALSLVTTEAYFSMIREGISLYGYPPVQTKLPFRPALQWNAEIVHVKEIEAGESVSYGRTFIAEHPMRIATVAVGYGDGYHRAASNRGQMLVRGRRASIIGRVCMDQTMLDVTDIPEVKVGDMATLIGAQGDDCISAVELAGWADTICYETLLAITARVPREYIPVA